MKVLVFSDSHGALGLAEEMLRRESDCSLVFFLGDGMDEAEKMRDKYKDKKFILVKGNNDWYSHADTEAYKYIDGMTIMACHGDAFGVRNTLRQLISKTDSVRGNLALYGHTHQRNLYSDAATGIFAVNPGAVCDGRYCVLDIKKGMFEYYPKDI